jgi:hypothetical protein
MFVQLQEYEQHRKVQDSKEDRKTTRNYVKG